MRENEPRVARSLADPAVGNDFFLGDDLAVDLVQFGARAETSVGCRSLGPGDTHRGRDVTAPQRAFLGVIGHVGTFAGVLGRRAHIDQWDGAEAAQDIRRVCPNRCIVTLDDGVFGNRGVRYVERRLPVLGQPRVAATVEQAYILVAEEREDPQCVCGPPVALVAVDDDGVIARREAETAVTYRRSGDDNVLVEYGDMTLDLALRARAHALHERIEAIAPTGLLDLTPGIRSLQVKVDPDVLPISTLMGLLAEVEDDLPAASELVVPSRTVRMPLSWDDPSTREAIQRYMHGVRADAPWCPWNIEFIRRMNGLDTVADVFDTVFAADYMVLGLGDVYLGAPVATPLDPRHRLVTTKYNPARTWTPENAVGIGGAYLCIYGMEGPGGYQFVGRTTQVWNHRYPERSGSFEAESPWLLRFFDRISWYPVEPEELMDLRADTAAGRGGGVEITDGEFSLAEHDNFLADNHDSIEEFRAMQAIAFDAERTAWSAAGEFTTKGDTDGAV